MSDRRAAFSSFCVLARGLAAVALGSWLGCSLLSCGGSSSETPPPLEPSPQNVRYDRSATTLPGEIGTPTRPAPPPSTKPALAPPPKRQRPPGSSQY